MELYYPGASRSEAIFQRGLLDGSGSGAGGAILIFHISRKQNRQRLFLGGPGANSFHEKMAPGEKESAVEKMQLIHLTDEKSYFFGTSTLVPPI